MPGCTGSPPGLPGTILAMSETADRADELYRRVVQLKEHL